MVADVYQALRRHKPPTRCLDVCLNCCMSPALEREMRRLPLSERRGQHFCRYNTSAKSEIQPVEEILYLLPRMLGPIADGDEVHHSIELSFDRLGRWQGRALSLAPQDPTQRRRFADKLMKPEATFLSAPWSMQFSATSSNDEIKQINRDVPHGLNLVVQMGCSTTSTS